MITNNLLEEGKEIICPKCNHEFIIRSKLQLLTCNNCGNKFRSDEGFTLSGAKTFKAKEKKE